MMAAKKEQSTATRVIASAFEWGENSRSVQVDTLLLLLLLHNNRQILYQNFTNDRLRYITFHIVPNNYETDLLLVVELNRDPVWVISDPIIIYDSFVHLQLFI